MGKFSRLIEQSNPDAPRYMANTGKYFIADVLKSAGIQATVKDFEPVLYFTVDNVKYKVSVEEASSNREGEEDQENLTNTQNTLTPEDEKALTLAKAFATKPRGGFMGVGTPQGKIDKAYGQMMNKVSQKISTIANKV